MPTDPVRSLRERLNRLQAPTQYNPACYGDAEDAQAFGHALSQNPHDAGARDAFADWLMDRGRDEEALLVRNAAPHVSVGPDGSVTVKPSQINPDDFRGGFGTGASAAGPFYGDPIAEEAANRRVAQLRVQKKRNALRPMQAAYPTAGTLAFAPPAQPLPPRVRGPKPYAAYSGDPEIDGLEAQLRGRHAGRAAEMEGWLRQAEERAAQPDVTADDIEQLRPVLERLRAQIEDRKRRARGDRPQTQYAHDSGPTPYAGADQQTVDHFWRELQKPEHATLRHGRGGDHILRQVAADAFQDHGDEESAEHLRDVNKHVVFTDDGRVVPGFFSTKHLRAKHLWPIHALAAAAGRNLTPVEVNDVGGAPVNPQWHDEDNGDDPLPHETHYPHGTVRLSVDGGSANHFHASEVPGRLADQMEHELNHPHGGHAEFSHFGTGVDPIRGFRPMLDALRNERVEFYHEPPPQPEQSADPEAPTPYAGADEGTVNDFLTQLQSPEHNATRWGHPEGDHTLRQVAADALQDNGRDDEAEHLRTPGRHVMVHQGRVVPGRWDATQLDQHLFPIHEHLDAQDVPPPRPEVWDVGGRRVDDAALPPPENHPGTTHYPAGHHLVSFDEEIGPFVGMHAAEVPHYIASAIYNDTVHDAGGYPGDDEHLEAMLDNLRNAQVEFPVNEFKPPVADPSNAHLDQYASPDSFTVYADDYPFEEPYPDDSLELPEADGDQDDGHAERMRDRHGDDWGRNPSPHDQRHRRQYPERRDYACGPAGADPCALRGRLEALKGKLCGPTEYGTGEDLLAGVRDNPDDHNARLVAADWMQENNRPHEEAVLRDLDAPVHVHPQGWAVAQGPPAPPGRGMGFGAWADRAAGVPRRSSDLRTTALWARKNVQRRFPDGWMPPAAGTGAFNPPPQPLPERQRGEQYGATEYGTGEDLLAAVQANPDSHDHRLVAADWFAENNRPLDEAALRDLNSPVYVHPAGWATPDAPTPNPRPGWGFGRTFGHNWYDWQMNPDLRRRVGDGMRDREYRLPPGGEHQSGAQHMPWNGNTAVLEDPKPMAGTGAFAPPPPGGPPKRVRGPKPYAATPYRYPTDDYGNITGIMTPVGQKTFLGGKWGPKPKVRGVGYARSVSYGNTSNVTEADFHRAIHDAPREDLHSLAYADWLEENGRPAHAAFIRTAVTSPHRGDGMPAAIPYPRYYSGFPSLVPGSTDVHAYTFDSDPNKWHLEHSVQSLAHPDRAIRWTQLLRGHSPEQVSDVVGGLLGEGAKAGDSVHHRFPELTSPEPPQQYSRTAYGDREDLEAFFHHVNAPWASHGEQDHTARSGLADWLAERGRDDEANWAADLAHPVGVSHGRVGPGSAHQLGGQAKAYLTNLTAFNPSTQRPHPDTIASAHNTWDAFAGAASPDADVANPKDRAWFFAPGDFFRARNRSAPGFVSRTPAHSGGPGMERPLALRLNALSRRFGRHTVQPHLIGDKMQLIHEGGFHTPMPEDPDPDYETDHGYASPDGPTNYDDSQDFETFANHVRSNQQDQGARGAFSDWLRDRGRDEEADWMTKPPGQKLAPGHAAGGGPFQLVGFHGQKVGPGHVTGLDPWAREYLGAALDTETDDDGNALGELLSGNDFHPDAIAAIHHTTNEFRRRAGHLLARQQNGDPSSYGPYHFLTTRNGHGTGFWADPDYWNTPGGNEAAELTDHAHAMGEHSFHVGDDGMIHSHEEGHYEGDQAPAMYADEQV